MVPVPWIVTVSCALWLPASETDGCASRGGWVSAAEPARRDRLFTLSVLLRVQMGLLNVAMWLLDSAVILSNIAWLLGLGGPDP